MCNTARQADRVTATRAVLEVVLGSTRKIPALAAAVRHGHYNRFFRSVMDTDFFAKVRRITIVSLFADDELAGVLALKGGNALSLVHGITSRTSIDLDFSIKEDFPDFPAAKARIFRVLKDRFDSDGYVVFDESLTPKPLIKGEDIMPRWGGYVLNFKLIKKQRYEQLIYTKPNKLSIEAMVTSPDNKRVFKVDFSKFEHIDGKEARDLDHYSIYVYTPEMIVLEKLRAICQQMPEYLAQRPGRAAARARDFYDIHEAIEKRAINLTIPENLETLHNIFEAKDVPLALLLKVEGTREFHRPDWISVETSVAGDPAGDYDFYFDFVLAQIEQLKSRAGSVSAKQYHRRGRADRGPDKSRNLGPCL